MPVPVVYRRAGENVFSNYNYVDIANGLGYNNFYLFATADNTGTYYYRLNNEKLASERLYCNVTETLTYQTSSFNIPRTVKGTAFVILSAEIVYTTSNWTCSGNIYKNTGGVQTLLAAFSFRTQNNAGMTMPKITEAVIPETVLDIGDKIDLEIIFTSDHSSQYYLDPIQTTSGNKWASRLCLPFKIDL